MWKHKIGSLRQIVGIYIDMGIFNKKHGGNRLCGPNSQSGSCPFRVLRIGANSNGDGLFPCGTNRKQCEQSHQVRSTNLLVMKNHLSVKSPR